MKKQLIFLIFLSVIVNANEEKLIEENKKTTQSIYFDEKPSVSQSLKTVDPTNKYTKGSDTDFSKYKKVSLMDVALETVSRSDLLKAAREQVIQSEIKLKDAIAGYYPTLNFESESGRTRATDVEPEKSFKYFNDRNYKFILNQNLYAGGETSNIIKSLEKRLDLEKNQYQVVLQEEITKSIKAYFDVVFSYRTVVVSESYMKNLNKILDIVTIKYDNGAATIGDLTAIKANVSNAETQLIKMKSKFTESLRYYEYIVGENYIETLPYEKNFNIDVSTFDLLLERGLKQNTNIMNYYKSIDAEKFNLRSKESGFAPKLDFELSLDNVMDKEGFQERESALNGLFRITFNLYNGGKDKNKILTSYSAIRELGYRLDEEKKKLKWNVSKLFTSIKSTNESLSSNISEIIALRKMVDSYWEEFSLGQQDLQALLQGHKQLNSAETELIKYENNNITDFFTLLGYTGDLLAFFDVDPEHPRFIDFSKTNYSQDIYIDDKFLNEKERLEREEEKRKDEELRKLLVDKATKDENIDNFNKKFLSSDDELYTIEIGVFNNQKDAITFIKDKQLDKNSFAYDTVSDTNIHSKIAHGIFPSLQEAKNESDKLSKDNIQKTLIVRKVKDIKKLYNDYILGLKVKPVAPEIKIVEKINTIEKIKQEKKEPEFQLNDTFKNSFLSASPNAYTINITSFNDKKDLENILQSNPSLYENSFAYEYLNQISLIRWDYGIYLTYEEALKGIESLGELKGKYYPVVQKISNEQELYKSNINDKVEEVKEAEFEYINVSSKTEYKEHTPVKENKAIENKVKNLFNKLNSKSSVEKNESEVAVEKPNIEIKKEKPVVKWDPKPVKEKDEPEIEVKKPTIENKKEKPVAEKWDPKPVKEKDYEELDKDKISTVGDR